MKGGEVARWELERGQDGYPSALEEIDGIGDVIYGMGDPTLLETPCISIIGARRASPYGVAVSAMAGRVAAECGITVVSGGARGCDHAAGRAAVDAGGKTIVVSGCGADLHYPHSSKRLFDEARSWAGAVISLEPWGAPPLPFTFPKRNRVIAALSRSLIVAEAGLPSGTFGTATFANELGRNVYAVPGSIFSAGSAGTNRLIESGAAIISDETALSVRISLDYGVLALQHEARESDDEVLRSLAASPSTPEDLARHLGIEVLEMLKVLANYEARGVVHRMPDGRLSLTKSAYLGIAGGGG